MEDDKKKRRKNKQSKQNLPTFPGGVCSSVNAAYDQQLSTRVADVAFSSLPPIHIGGVEPSVAVVEGETSRSCPSQISTSLLEAQGSKGRRLLPNPAKTKHFAPHWSENAVEEAFEKGNAFRATFRVNAHNPLEAYCTIDGVPVDILIKGIVAQNRAIEGDIVAIMLDPVACWSKLKGLNVSSHPLLTEDSIVIPEVRENDKNVAQKERIEAKRLLPSDSGYIENGNRNSSVSNHLYMKNGYGHNDNNKSDDFHQHTPLENSNAGCVSYQEEAARALGRICAIMSSCPLKRPTGRVIAILKKSPRRGAVIGFLAAKEYFVEGKGHKKQCIGFREGKNGISVSGEYIKLLPTDPKFPRMVVSVTNLPESAKERVSNGDVTIGRELVAAQIDEWTDESPSPLARVVRMLGRGGDIEPQIAAILFENAIYDAKFSHDSLACLPELPWEIPAKELETRKDFRKICTFTIDPSTAIDLDDALSIEIVSDEVFRIGVHIADVSYFIPPESALDSEARMRSTSIYILQHKLPMLPPQLCEEFCSLLPGKDRLAFSLTWDINRSGNITGRWIGRSIICSCCKLSYELVQDIICGSLEANRFMSSGSSIPQLYSNFKWEDVFKSLKSFYEISTSLKDNRFKDGALSLESSKFGILFDEFGTPYDSFLHERKESCSLVEEFMLLANRSIAEVISMAFPDCALLRRHPEPNIRKLGDFETFCRKFGIELDTSSSGQFHLSLSKIREKLKDDVLSDILMSYASRPMQQALYFCTGDLRGRENEWSHYALSVPFYTHFTSPLRRYPDIIVHRTLSATLDAEGAYMKQRKLNNSETCGSGLMTRCFTGLIFDRTAAGSEEGREALAAAAAKFKVPISKVLTEVASYCNERKVASRHAEEAGEKLYLWALLKKKEIVVSEATVLGLGPKFMSVYVHKFAMERRIHYGEVEGLAVEWLEMTSTLLLDLRRNKHKKTVPSWKLRPLEDVVLVMNPSEENEAPDEQRTCPAAAAVLPMVFHHLSIIPVALHAVGGDDGPLDIGVRLYICSYFSQNN